MVPRDRLAQEHGDYGGLRLEARGIDVQDRGGVAIGGALTLLRSSEEIITVMSLLPFGATPSRGLWDLKMMGLIIIFVYAFFKFAWSYRLFNYFAIMVGAAPPPREKDTAAAQAFALGFVLDAL